MSGNNFFMKLALKEAEEALKIGEIPIGAVIVKNGEVISKAHNLRETDKNALYHAEILAINDACNTLDTWRLSDCDMRQT